MSLHISEDSEGALLRVRAAPGASRERIVEPHAEALKIAVTAAPEKGKANQRICAVLAKALKLPPRDVELLSGSTARDKMVRIRGWTARALGDRLGELLTPNS